MMRMRMNKMMRMIGVGMIGIVMIKFINGIEMVMVINEIEIRMVMVMVMVMVINVIGGLVSITPGHVKLDWLPPPKVDRVNDNPAHYQH